MKLIDSLLERNSARGLIEPFPDSNEMEKIYQAALRAPDHAKLKPARFIQITGQGLNKLSSVFYDFAKNELMIKDESVLQKYKDAPFRAPMIIILVTKHQEHPKVPLIEQKLSTAASAQNILLALESYGYAGIWRTGKFSFNNKLLKYLNLDDNNTILGYLYVGTRDGDKKKISNYSVDEFVSIWE